MSQTAATPSSGLRGIRAPATVFDVHPDTSGLEIVPCDNAKHLQRERCWMIAIRHDQSKQPISGDAHRDRAGLPPRHRFRRNAKMRGKRRGGPAEMLSEESNLRRRQPTALADDYVGDHAMEIGPSAAARAHIRRTSGSGGSPPSAGAHPSVRLRRTERSCARLASTRRTSCSSRTSSAFIRANARRTCQGIDILSTFYLGAGGRWLESSRPDQILQKSSQRTEPTRVN
jgi:hypothetical protein